MSAERKIYFAAVMLPNEGEPEQALEVSILEWRLIDEPGSSANSSTLPKVYVHSTLAPRSLNRVRWGNAGDYGIDARYIKKNLRRLPSIETFIGQDYLKDAHAVVFDASKEPVHSLVSGCRAVEEIQSAWAQVFRGSEDEKVRSASTLSQMLECLGYPSVREVSAHSTHYPPLILETFAMAAVWSVLENFKAHPRKSRKLSGTLPFSPVWPVREAPDVWFEGERKSLSDFTAKEIDTFFAGEMQSYIDWRRTNIYINDWVFNRERLPIITSGALSNVDDMAEYIFTKIFRLEMQLWSLVFYSVFENRTSYARDVALKDGRFASLDAPVRTDFSAFIIGHMQDFLMPEQKQWLLKTIIGMYIRSKARVAFEPFDFDAMSREQQRDPANARFFFRSGPEGSRPHCFHEIATRDKVIKYRCYEISGHGEEREQTIIWVNEYLRRFMDEAKNPFSNFWTTPDARQWIRIITGVAWGDISRAPRINEDSEIIKVRYLVSGLIRSLSLSYVQELHDRLAADIRKINSEPNHELDDKFCFMGVSVEIRVMLRSKTPVLRRLFNFS